jgi:putative ABC transport system ATP-binding protein
LAARGLARTFAAGASRFTLEVEEVVLHGGDCVAVVGPSGCGKSTLLGILALALAPDPSDVRGSGQAGGLTVAGTDAWALWRRRDTDALARLRADHLGFVPQTAALLPFLSLRGNIELPQQIAGRRDRTLVDGLAARLRIDDILDRRPAQVSVGQRQRAAVARALAHRPLLVLADEPTASVHPAQADEILVLLAAVASQEGAALMVATHDPARAAAAGYAIAPCRPDAHTACTRFSWTTASGALAA